MPVDANRPLFNLTNNVFFIIQKLVLLNMHLIKNIYLHLQYKLAINKILLLCTMSRESIKYLMYLNSSYLFVLFTRVFGFYIRMADMQIINKNLEVM